MMKFILIVAVLGIFSGYCADGLAEYGAKTRFSKDSEIRFRDFTLTYRGARNSAGDRSPNGFTYHDFIIRSRDGERPVSWSSGAGDIGPTEFEISGARFALELRVSDRLGKLNDDELVVSKK